MGEIIAVLLGKKTDPGRAASCLGDLTSSDIGQLPDNSQPICATAHN